MVWDLVLHLYDCLDTELLFSLKHHKQQLFKSIFKQRYEINLVNTHFFECINLLGSSHFTVKQLWNNSHEMNVWK